MPNISPTIHSTAQLYSCVVNLPRPLLPPTGNAKPGLRYGLLHQDDAKIRIASAAHSNPPRAYDPDLDRFTPLARPKGLDGIRGTPSAHHRRGGRRTPRRTYPLPSPGDPLRSSPRPRAPHQNRRRRRLAEPGSRHGSLVVVYTHAGELTLDGEAVSFHETLAGAFSRAGFRVDSAGRRLLGVIEVLGLFNAITRAAREAAAGDPAAGSEAPAALPSEFAARVVLSEACEDGAGRSTGACELGDGRRADWAEQDAEGGTALRWEEEQYSLTLGGRRYARETATSAQWPGQSVTALYNETHELVFQTYRGARYHCALRNGSALRAPPPTDSDDGPGPRAELLGFAEVAGVHCRHFRLTVPAGDGPPQAVDLYEDHARRLLRAVRLGGLRWLFANLTAVAGEDQNPLAPADLDLEAVLRDCDPPGIVPPPRIVRGLLTPRLDEDPSWGRPAPQPPPPNASNATLPPAPAPLASSGPGDSEGLRALSAAGAGVGGGGANESSSSAGGDSDGPGPRGCRSRSTNLRGFSASYQECSTSTEITMAGAKPWPACPAISGVRPGPPSRSRPNAGGRSTPRRLLPWHGGPAWRRIGGPGSAWLRRTPPRDCCGRGLLPPEHCAARRCLNFALRRIREYDQGVTHAGAGKEQRAMPCAPREVSERREPGHQGRGLPAARQGW